MTSHRWTGEITGETNNQGQTSPEMGIMTITIIIEMVAITIIITIIEITKAITIAATKITAAAKIIITIVAETENGDAISTMTGGIRIIAIEEMKRKETNPGGEALETVLQKTLEKLQQIHSN